MQYHFFRMNFKKRATISGLTSTIVVIAVVLIVWIIINGSLKEASASVIDTLKDKLGLVTKEEKEIKFREEEVKKEIREMEKKNTERAMAFLNNLVGGYESCLE